MCSILSILFAAVVFPLCIFGMWVLNVLGICQGLKLVLLLSAFAVVLFAVIVNACDD